MTISHQPHRWSSRFTYILAATGAAVGLGNIWKFPYIMGENGGGAFVLVYLLCIAFIGIPVLIGEVIIGKFGRQTPVKSAVLMAQSCGGGKRWAIVGWSGVLAGFLILSFYVVIAGWALAYTWYGFQGRFEGGTLASVATLFRQLNAHPLPLMAWSGLVILAMVWVVGKELQQGLEKAASWLMPLMVVFLLILVLYAGRHGDITAALNFMFRPDFSSLTWQGVLVALGHSLFSLSLATGIMIMYGAYLPDGTSVVKTSLWIALLDTGIAMLAGLAIYPIVFAHGLAPGAGPGLIFQSLPIAFGQMPVGQLFGGLFFLVVVVAAFTSAIALIEASVAWLVERKGLARMQAALVAGAGIWLLSLLTIFSFTGASWSQFTLADGRTITLYWLLDQFTANLLLPLGGLVTALFTGYRVSRDVSFTQVGASRRIYRLWRLCVRVIAPLAILAVLLKRLEIMTF